MAVPGRNFVINLIGNSTPAENAFKRTGQAAGRLATPIGIATAAITASFAAVVGAVGKVGKELLDLGEQFNDAYRTIQVGTGAIGDDLEALRQSFRDVAGAVPSSFGDTATAIAEVNTRLGLTGDDLDKVSEQFLNLSRLTGGDVTADIRGATRMFNRFGVEAEDTSDMLDFLFRVSQATGIGIEKLGKNTTDYGAQLQNLGLSLEESVAFMGLLEREGASVTRIMPSLNTAALKLKAEGFDNVNEGLVSFIDELRTLDDDAAESRAIEILGSQYRNFLDVVRDNNIDYGALVQQLQDSQVTINDTAAETDGVREAWAEFKNFLKLQFEGPATAVFEGVRETVMSLKPAAEEVMEAYEERGLGGALERLAEEWDKIYGQYLEPLWLRFLDFLEFDVLPAALEIGGAIGSALGQALQNGVGKYMESLAQKFLDNPLTWLIPGQRAIALGLRSLGRTLQDDIDLGLPGERRVPIVDVVPELPSGLEFGRGGLPAIPNPEQPSGRSAGLPAGVEYGRGGLPVIPAMGRGGLVSSPTLALVGEAGPEVVVPLDRMGGMGTTVNVTVTSADPQAVVDAIRRYTRANGPLGQVVTV